MNTQELYNNTCHSLRTYGNQYGSRHTRNWGWVNKNDPNDRCAIAKFVSGNTNDEVMCNLKTLLNVSEDKHICTAVPIIGTLTTLYDIFPEICNNTEQLEDVLKNIADSYNLKYTAPETTGYNLTPVAQKELVLEV